MSDISTGKTVSDGSADVTVLGELYSDTPRLSGQRVPTSADVVLVRVGRGQVVLGAGGYYSPE